MLDCDFIFSSQLCDIVRICTQHKNSISRRHIISTSGHFELLLTNPSWNSVSVLSNWRDFTRLNQCVIAFTIPEKYWVILKYQNSHHMQMEGKANGSFQFERNSVLLQHITFYAPSILPELHLTYNLPWCKAHICDNVFHAMQQQTNTKTISCCTNVFCVFTCHNMVCVRGMETPCWLCFKWTHCWLCSRKHNIVKDIFDIICFSSYGW